MVEIRTTLQRLENKRDYYEQASTFTSDNGENKGTLNADLLNSPISLDEVNRVLFRAKSWKAIGIENIPNEILKCGRLAPVLYRLFNACFMHNIISSMWYKIIIQSVLKHGEDSRDPLNYRGISLMSTIAKLISTVLNDRICSYLDENDLVNEEQN